MVQLIVPSVKEQEELLAKQKAIQEEQARIEKEREDAEREEKERIEKEKQDVTINCHVLSESERQKNTVSANLAEVFNTNRQYINEAKKLKEQSPEKFEAVKNGEKNLICVYANKVFIVLLIPTF